MFEKTAGPDRVDRRLPLYAALGVIVLFVPVAFSQPDISLLGYVLLITFISLASIVVFLRDAMARRTWSCVSIVSMLIVGWTISSVLVANDVVIRGAARWLVWSNHYKAEVLAKPISSDGGLKHIEWDGWGWAGQDTTVYLVFDPTDSLSTAARSHESGMLSGIPCEVNVVRRLEGHWYSAQFYTNEFWDRCH